MSPILGIHSDVWALVLDYLPYEALFNLMAIGNHVISQHVRRSTSRLEIKWKYRGLIDNHAIFNALTSFYHLKTIILHSGLYTRNKRSQLLPPSLLPSNLTKIVFSFGSSYLLLADYMNLSDMLPLLEELHLETEENDIEIPHFRNLPPQLRILNLYMPGLVSISGAYFEHLPPHLTSLSLTMGSLDDWNAFANATSKLPLTHLSVVCIDWPVIEHASVLRKLPSSIVYLNLLAHIIEDDLNWATLFPHLHTLNAAVKIVDWSQLPVSLTELACTSIPALSESSTSHLFFPKNLVRLGLREGNSATFDGFRALAKLEHLSFNSQHMFSTPLASTITELNIHLSSIEARCLPRSLEKLTCLKLLIPLDAPDILTIVPSGLTQLHVGRDFKSHFVFCLPPCLTSLRASFSDSASFWSSLLNPASLYASYPHLIEALAQNGIEPPTPTAFLPNLISITERSKSGISSFSCVPHLIESLSITFRETHVDRLTWIGLANLTKLTNLSIIGDHLDDAFEHIPASVSDLVIYFITSTPNFSALPRRLKRLSLASSGSSDTALTTEELKALPQGLEDLSWSHRRPKTKDTDTAITLARALPPSISVLAIDEGVEVEYRKVQKLRAEGE